MNTKGRLPELVIRYISEDWAASYQHLYHQLTYRLRVLVATVLLGSDRLALRGSRMSFRVILNRVS